jgi:hypothetical protein
MVVGEYLSLWIGRVSARVLRDKKSLTSITTRGSENKKQQNFSGGKLCDERSSSVDYTLLIFRTTL